MKIYKTVSEEIAALKSRHTKNSLRANAIIAAILVITVFAAVALPLLVGVPYSRAFATEAGDRVLFPFVTLSVVWFGLAAFWRVPAQFASLPAISLLMLGYTVASWMVR